MSKEEKIEREREDQEVGWWWRGKHTEKNESTHHSQLTHSLLCVCVCVCLSSVDGWKNTCNAQFSLVC
jgi:hypothetical protein